MDKKINYLNRDFQGIRNELETFTKKYYPELAEEFDDSSVGSWIMDLMAAVGDTLSYHTDRVFQEQNINSANMESSIKKIARNNGVKIPGPKASMCEVEIQCNLGVDPTAMSMPDYSHAPIVKRDSIVSSGEYEFEFTEDVDFSTQFNSDGYSNRKFTPIRDSNGKTTGYTVSKTTLVVGGTTRVYKKVISSNDLQPFMEVTLPDKNIMNVESVIFKESSSFDNDPKTYEYYIDEEEYYIENSTAKTYRFFEVDNLSQQYRFGVVTNGEKDDNDTYRIDEVLSPYAYDDFIVKKDGTDVPFMRYYRGEWKPITQKFITERTDSNYTKVIFGSGVNYDTVPNGTNNHSQLMMSNIINNDMLGVLPKAGWTMYILYRVGGGVSTNVSKNAINEFSLANVSFKSSATNGQVKGNVVNSLTVKNITNSLAGTDAPSTEELKYLIKYNNGAQERCVTIEDYKCRLMQMPPKFGAPFRNNVIEENNKVMMSFLGLKNDGTLDNALPEPLIENVEKYMSRYKTLTDYIEIKSGKIYNLGFEIDVFIDKNYNTSDVIKNIINGVKSYMDVNKHFMGEDIFLGDLEKEINLTDGVISLIDMRVSNIYGGTVYNDQCTLPIKNDYNSSCNVSVNQTLLNLEGGAKSYEIDLDSIDHVLSGEYNAMYEILNINDIVVRAKTK